MIRTIVTILIGFCLALASFVGAAHAAAEPKKKEATPLATLISMNPFTLSVIDNHRPVGMLVVELAINAPKLEDFEALKRQIPRLRDRFLKVLNAYAANEAQMDRVLHVARISGRLQVALNDILGGRRARLLVSNIKLQRTS